MKSNANEIGGGSLKVKIITRSIVADSKLAESWTRWRSPLIDIFLDISYINGIGREFS